MKTLATFLYITCASAITASKPVTSSLDEVQFNIDPKGVLMTASSPAEFSNWKDWESWEAPAKIVKLAPYYRCGYDYDGLPVHVIKYGKWNYREIANLPEKELRDFHKFLEQILRSAAKDGTANDDQGVVYILDWDGFNLKNFASKKALGLAQRNFVLLMRVNQNMKYAIHVNANYAAEMFLNLCRPLLANVLENAEIYGTRSEKWKPALFRKLPRDQLPPQYGGTTDWKRLPLIST